MIASVYLFSRRLATESDILAFEAAFIPASADRPRSAARVQTDSPDRPRHIGSRPTQRAGIIGYEFLGGTLALNFKSKILLALESKVPEA